MIKNPFAAPPVEATEAALDLLHRTFRGDPTDSLLEFLERVDDEGPWAGNFIHALLRLCRALALRNRSDDGILQLYGTLQVVAETDRDPYRRLAARLILAHTLVADASEIDGLASVGIDTSVAYNSGATSFNEAIEESGGSFYEMLTAALVLWRWLLPEVSIAASELLEAAASDMNRRES